MQVLQRLDLFTDTGDYAAAEANQYGVLHLTIYVGLSWRQEAEEHAGGNMAWNTRVDYGRILARSSIRAEVAALYAQAGLSLSGDLATLAAAPQTSPGRTRAGA